MSKVNKLSFLTLVGVIFLIPLFFLPTTLVPLGMAKVVLMSIAAVAVAVFFIIETIKTKIFSFPRSKILWASLLLPVAYILSALLSGQSNLSMFGYALEPGTAGSLVLLCALFFFVAIFFKDRSKLIRVISVVFLSLGILSLFSLIKILSGGSWLTLSTFTGSMGNPVGAWTDLAMAMGLLALITSFAIEMLPLTGMTKFVAWVSYAVSVVVLIVANFTAAWWLTLVVSVALFTYLATVEKDSARPLSSRAGAWTAGILALIAILFIWNPGNLGGAISSMTHVNNLDVRPNLTSTLSVAKSTLAKNPLLGSGPNTFDKDWLLFRPADTNQTIFWNVGFFYGYGFLPTTISNVGLLGLAVWLCFLILFIMLGIKALARGPSNRADRFLVTSTFLSALFLWLGAFVYVPSLVMLALAFIFTGLFVGAAAATEVIGTKTMILNGNRLGYFASILVVIVLAVGTVAFAKEVAVKTAGVFHFQKAVAYSNQGKSIDDIESELGKAITSAPADPYWSAVSQIELSRANQIANNASLSDSDKATKFQNALSASISAQQNAIALNKSYQNYIALGNIYASLVPPPFSVDGAYDVAKDALNKAVALNPLSPEVAVLLAKLEFDKKNISEARIHIDDAIKLKQDYADAYFLLSQIEVGDNNLAKAIKSAETGALLSPGNAGVYFELGLLKFANKDYTGAVEAMNNALAIVPDYANAKYYLGLSYDKLGKTDDAIKQFEELAKTNPDNELVTSALANLKAGKDALSPADKKSTQSLPISGQ